MSKHRLRRSGAVLVAVSGFVAIPLAIATPAQASHAGGASSGILNTANWQVCTSRQVDDQGGISYAMTQVGQTDVNTATVDCHAGVLNIIAYADDYPDSWYGQTGCLGTITNGRCGSKSVRLNGRTITTQTQWRKSATHEFGHVAGLGHRNTNTSCMTQGEAPPIATTFDAHDLEAINATY